MNVRLHHTTEDLRQILHLQKQNHKDFIPKDQAQKEGYVTVLHDLRSLSEICGDDGHVIATDAQGKVIGYALTMHSTYADKIPVLYELMEQLRIIIGQNRFLIMGQLCVAKAWRGKGVVGTMYDHMRESFKDQYAGIYTDAINQCTAWNKTHTEKIDGLRITMLSTGIYARSVDDPTKLMRDSAELIIKGVIKGVQQDKANAPGTILVNSRHSHGDKERIAFKSLYQDIQLGISPQVNGFTVLVE